MSRFKQTAWLVVILVLALAFAGCAKPPEAEQQAAKAAQEAAVAAGADKYAVAELEAAKKLWGSAEAQMQEKKYKEAQPLYVDAKAAFEKAAGAVEAGRKAAAAEAAAAIAALEESWKGLDAAARKVEKRMKEKKEAWEAEAKAFLEGLNTGKEMAEKDPLGAKAKLDELKTFIEKWDTAIKELAALPEPAPLNKSKKKS
jgi:hypothetical protein